MAKRIGSGWVLLLGGLVACSGAPAAQAPRPAQTPRPALSAEQRRSDAFEFLMGPDGFIVGSFCGNNHVAEECWLALHELTNAAGTSRLRTIAAQAATPEGKLFGVVGLYKVGVFNREEATQAMLAISGDMWACHVCTPITSEAPQLAALLDEDAPEARKRVKTR